MKDPRLDKPSGSVRLCLDPAHDQDSWLELQMVEGKVYLAQLDSQFKDISEEGETHLVYYDNATHEAFLKRAGRVVEGEGELRYETGANLTKTLTDGREILPVGIVLRDKPDHHKIRFFPRSYVSSEWDGAQYVVRTQSMLIETDDDLVDLTPRLTGYVGLVDRSVRSPVEKSPVENQKDLRNIAERLTKQLLGRSNAIIPEGFAPEITYHKNTHVIQIHLEDEGKFKLTGSENAELHEMDGQHGFGTRYFFAKYANQTGVTQGSIWKRHYSGEGGPQDVEMLQGVVVEKMGEKHWRVTFASNNPDLLADCMKGLERVNKTTYVPEGETDLDV